MNFIRVNAQERFYSKLAGAIEPEQKRRIIGEEFIRVFEEEAHKIGAVDYLVQGTIYPDVIESGLGKSAVIKSCLLYTSPSPRDRTRSRMPSSA